MNEPTRFIANGRAVAVADDPATPLLDVLRNTLAITGPRYGCGQELCGACMVLVDGTPSYACTRELWSVAGRAVTTVEGLAGHAVIAALLAEQAGQCGYCLSGIAVSAAALLAGNAEPSRSEIATALEPHLCRCGSQPRVLRAVARAAAALKVPAA
jgi:aerobic-type carbon monoxide dehydrogenase small subunit (CoxS/CutS family)